MAQASPLLVRFSGLVLAVGGATLGAVAYYLTCLVLNWAMPNWVPAEFRLAPQEPVRGLLALKDSLVGQAAAFLWVFAALAGLNAVVMLATGRRNWLLVAPLLAMFVIFIGAALWGTMQGGMAGLPVTG